MPLYWTIDSKERLFTGFGGGEVIFDDAVSLLQALAGARALSYRKLFDGRAVQSMMTSEHRYRRTIEALGSLKVKSAYLDGELCALNGDGVPVFSRLQAAMDEGRTDQLVFFAFDLLFLNGMSTGQLPLIKRKERLQRLFKEKIGGLRYSEHVQVIARRSACKACEPVSRVAWLR